MAKNNKTTNTTKDITSFLVKTVIVVVALLLAAYLITSAVLSEWNPGKWNAAGTRNEQSDGELNTDNSGLLAPDEHEANGIKFKKTIIPAALYSDYGVSAAAETALQLTITPTPENSDLTDGTFTIKYENDSSEWATSHTLSDHVTLNQSDERNATVTCLQAFGEPIIVVYTVTGENNQPVTAEYTLNYAKRITMSTEEFFVKFNDSMNYSPSTVILYEELNTENTYVTLNSNMITYSDYTVDDTFTIDSSSTFKLTESFKNACQSAGITLPGANKTGSFLDGKLYVTDGTESMLNYYFGESVYKTEAFRNVVSESFSYGVFEVEITMTGTHSTWTGSRVMYVSANGIPVAAQSVQLQDQYGQTSHMF